MTRTERALAHRWRSLALVCTLVALAGAVIVIWARITTEADRADQLAAEADRRGSAVTTLAADVRTLRAQVKAAGRTPAAPDPSQAIDGLRDRARVPVPIPGPRGEQGPPGKNGTNGVGQPGKNGTNGKNGQNGADGQPGADSTVPGPAGPAGPAGPQGRDGVDGQDGTDGRDGKDGQTCPDGYSLQPPANDPDALVCRRDGAPSPDPSPTTSAPPAILAPERRRP
ncbi:collagen-like protein [Streptomyces piniterrae]|uniref:Collagen-like protein n=1 Tax=Streptomyces piniterrae TaxID=2571125 RepID=A0A4U0NZ27_9ACTN|nr:collagen-like protein [Streptomyces piniterrae]TJZ55624.1 collagen-like protein [Streptomyces piniterrae]